MKIKKIIKQKRKNKNKKKKKIKIKIKIKNNQFQHPKNQCGLQSQEFLHFLPIIY